MRPLSEAFFSQSASAPEEAVAVAAPAAREAVVAAARSPRRLPVCPALMREPAAEEEAVPTQDLDSKVAQLLYLGPLPTVAAPRRSSPFLFLDLFLDLRQVRPSRRRHPANI
jgi:hypothetical protein